MIGAIFWIIIAIWIGSKIGKSTGGEVNVWTEKQFDKEEQKIAKKYDTTGYPKAYVTVWKHGPEAYKKYNDEVNVVRKKYGKKEYPYEIPTKS